MNASERRAEVFEVECLKNLLRVGEVGSNKSIIERVDPIAIKLFGNTKRISSESLKERIVGK